MLADSFETRYHPFTLEKPRCLLPLANVPLIEYTLEFLAMSGVLEIYVYCGSHTDQVEQYLKSSKWYPGNSTSSPFTSLEIVKTTSRSVGDAMRDLDSRDLITGDFLLVHGDLISNLPIDEALAKHRARRTADKNAIMTVILRSGGLGSHRTKTHGVTPVFVIDPRGNRCLHYEEISPFQSHKYVGIDPDILSEHTEFEIRTDFIDCGIDICTPDVLALWSESFDYEIPRRHFLHGVLKDYELNGKTIHAEIIQDYYAARASNLQAYEAISRDVLGRWTYPLVPDSNLMKDHTYKFERSGLCKENGVILARSCRIGKKTVLGRDTSIGAGSVVSNSIIGRRCQIGKNVVIENAYIWDDVVIGDGTEVRRAVVASEVVVGRDCKVQEGGLLSFGVRIADSTALEKGARVTCARRNQDDGEEDQKIASDPSLVGENGQGYSYEDSDDEDEEAVAQSTLIYNISHLSLSSDSISTLASSSSSVASQPRSRLSSFTGSLSEDGEGSLPGANHNESFHIDAVADVIRTLSENGSFDNLRVEFTSLRLSNNASDHQMCRAIAVAFTKRIAQLVSESSLETSKAVAATLDQEGALAFLNDVAIGREKAVDKQVDFLLCAQRDLTKRASGEIILAALCQGLYERDLLEEEAVEAWWEDEKSIEGEGMQQVRSRTQVFITWLREAEEEESSEEEEDDDDSD